eukprot:4389232-Pleurochrysis_carterae.AAC.1
MPRCGPLQVLRLPLTATQWQASAEVLNLLFHLTAMEPRSSAEGAPTRAASQNMRGKFLHARDLASFMQIDEKQLVCNRSQLLVTDNIIGDDIPDKGEQDKAVTDAEGVGQRNPQAKCIVKLVRSARLVQLRFRRPHLV